MNFEANPDGLRRGKNFFLATYMHISKLKPSL
jgi:hypothetical protein